MGNELSKIIAGWLFGSWLRTWKPSAANWSVIRVPLDRLLPWPSFSQSMTGGQPLDGNLLPAFGDGKTHQVEIIMG